MSSEGTVKSTATVRALAVILARLRHEFRSHLTAIIGCSELLLEDCQNESRRSLISDLRKVHLSGQHMLKLINRLLDPDDLETASSDQALKECAARAVAALRPPLDTVIKFSELLLENASELQDADYLNDLRSIRTASDKMLALLISLALDKREAGSIESDPQSSSRKTSDLLAPNSDRKIGMTAALKPLSKEEIEMATAERGRLLVVDNDQRDRNLLARRLRRFGHNVESAENGRQALAMMRDGQFDLVVLDILMPEMNGFQALQEIQADVSLREIPVIVASSLHEIDSVARAISLGAADYLQKPFNSVLLRTRIAACLEKKRLRDQELFYLRELERLNQDLETRNEFIRRTFGRYTSNELVERLLETSEGLKLGGESRQVTILMSDLRGFTSLAERLSPEQTVALLNTYLGKMAEVILNYQGFIDEFIGDAILAIFGAPIQREDDASRAVTCAIAMQLAMGAVNDQNRRDGLPEIAMGIGINTGVVVVGNIGSARRAKYGVIGSQVNLTSRIESFTSGGQVFISESTREAVGAAFKIDGQMSVEAKGVERPIRIYDVRIENPSNSLLIV